MTFFETIRHAKNLVRGSKYCSRAFVSCCDDKSQILLIGMCAAPAKRAVYLPMLISYRPAERCELIVLAPHEFNAYLDGDYPALQAWEPMVEVVWRPLPFKLPPLHVQVVD